MRRLDWNLRTCARRGHETYRPDEAELAQRLTAATPLGETWRCLRCGDYVLGEPAGSGPADEAPIVLRGKALKDAFVLRLLAVERFGRGLLFLLFGYAVVRFSSAQASLRLLFERDLPAAKPLADRLGIDLDAGFLVTHIRSLLNVPHGKLTLVTAFLFGYGAVQVLEGVGLWMLKRWGEYVAVVATSAFLPVEVYELVEKVTPLRVGALLLNSAAVFYLVWSKRLFGVRGGHAAYEAERHAESLLEVEQAGHVTAA